MIRLSPAAARQIHDALDENAHPALSLRVAARMGADGAPEFAMGWDEAREGDLSLDEKGIPLLIGVASRDLLANMQIDFVEVEPGEFRFIFIAGEACQSLPGKSAGTSADDGPGACRSGGCTGCGPSVFPCEGNAVRG